MYQRSSACCFYFVRALLQCTSILEARQKRGVIQINMDLQLYIHKYKLYDKVINFLSQGLIGRPIFMGQYGRVLTIPREATLA